MSSRGLRALRVFVVTARDPERRALDLLRRVHRCARRGTGRWRAARCGRPASRRHDARGFARLVGDQRRERRTLAAAVQRGDQRRVDGRRPTRACRPTGSNENVTCAPREIDDEGRASPARGRSPARASRRRPPRVRRLLVRERDRQQLRLAPRRSHQLRRPTGTPSSVNPAGMLIAGRPVLRAQLTVLAAALRLANRGRLPPQRRVGERRRDAARPSRAVTSLQQRGAPGPRLRDVRRVGRRARIAPREHLSRARSHSRRARGSRRASAPARSATAPGRRSDRT